MSVKGKNGNGRIAKYNRQVAEKAGLEKGESLPYAPDFLDALVRRMAIPVPGETAERCLAWLMYRAGGNQSLKAIHLYSKNGEPPTETELWQSDCALELAWVEAGHRAEWLDAPRDLFQTEAKRRGVKPVDKSVVSRGFQFNRLRGSMECETGYALVYVPAPDPTSFSGARETCRRKGESLHKTKHFTEWARFSYAREFEEYTVARATERRLLRFLTANYKNENGSETPETNAAPSLESLEPLESLETPPSPTSPPSPAPTAASLSLKPLSVGRSSSEPTDRPELVPEINPFKPKIREWLESQFAAAIPGFDLEEAELCKIADTIQTEAHLKQFQEAALRQQNPRGWIVFVRIAESCAKKHAQYESAMSAAANGGKQESLMERAMRIRGVSHG